MSDYRLRMHDIPTDDRPTERLLKYGPEALSTAELLGGNPKDRNAERKCSEYVPENILRVQCQTTESGANI